MPSPSTRAVALFAALIVAFAAACAPSTGSGSSPAATQAPTEPLDCKTVGYACSWSEVSPETAERSRALAREATSRVTGGSTIPAAADWLDSQDGVTSVTHGEGVLRFMLEGGRPVWVSVGSKGAELKSTTALRGQLASAGDPSSLGLPAGGSEPQTNALGGGPLLRVVGEDREAKKAVVLAPFGYVESMEAGEIAGLLANTRGYEGNVTYLENVTPASKSVTVDTFTNLTGNDVIYLDSYGGTTNPNDREPAHGFIAVSEVNADFHLTDIQDIGLDIVMLEDHAEYLAVTADFFRGLYPGGFENSLIFLNVDRLTDEALIRAIKSGSSELYAWNGDIQPAAARSAITPYIENLSVTGRSSEVVYHEMLDQLVVDGAKFVGYTPASKAGMRIRETAWIRNPADGSPLNDGDEIAILGELGDEKPDIVTWIVDIDGVDVATSEPERTSMAIYIDTLEGGSALVAELDQIDDYTFRAEGEFELPYDLEEGDRLSLEAVINLPDGGPSRHSLTVDVTDAPRPDIGTIWKGEATVTSNTLWPGVTITKTATVEFTRDPDEKFDAKKVTFNVTAGSMTWTMEGDSGTCSYAGGPITVPLNQGDRGGLTFDLTQPGAVTYFGDAGVATGPKIQVGVDCGGQDRSFVTRADGRAWFAPMDLVWVMNGPEISGTYRMDAQITGTYTWTFTKVR